MYTLKVFDKPNHYSHEHIYSNFRAEEALEDFNRLVKTCQRWKGSSLLLVHEDDITHERNIVDSYKYLRAV
jgi:hypothetical protein